MNASRRTRFSKSGGMPIASPPPSGRRSGGNSAAMESDPGAASAAHRTHEAICHDLEVPLSRATATLRAMQARDIPATHDPCASQIELALLGLHRVDRILSTLPDLLARPARPTMAVDLRALIDEVREDLEDVWADHSLRIVRDLPRVVADPGRLRIAVRNLLFHCVGHRHRRLPAEICIRGWRYGNRTSITLMDNARRPACGTTTGAGPGSALQIARRAVEDCGGSLRLVPRIGRGPAALLDLAAAPQAEATRRRRIPCTPAPGRFRPR